MSFALVTLSADHLRRNDYSIPVTFTQDKFFQDFAAAFAKLLSLGAPAAAVVAKPWYQFW